MTYLKQLSVQIGVSVSAFFLFAYTLLFMLSNNLSFISAFIGAFINTATLLFWSIGAIAILKRLINHVHFWKQVPLHILLSFLFSMLWYFSITVIFGWKNGNFMGAFSVEPFSTVAFIWQFFQGLVIYLLLLSVTISWQNWLSSQSQKKDPHQNISKLLVKEGEEILAVPIDSIICISGAGDYSEIVTPEKTYLTRKRLNEFEKLLPSEFIRVHRSHLININKMTKAQPIGGGRLRIYQQNNVTVDTSRTGSRLLRDVAS
ncbi:LytTR family transcriptional regulator [Alteromonas sediminis]|uniref:LytTR family transcriptional regulator n=1 Tax=Alteromonas sediminis TaxID=2259342 RepID=A0A3N5Y9U7_9ALTE|nr:LytTR family DNA-binding domain-containing protein [Alteromonas sediminis]RPJ68129.1 LytTR family transcriptional regulator [Alteromonas sediminis]